jgi:hypothetical protein
MLCQGHARGSDPGQEAAFDLCCATAARLRQVGSRGMVKASGLTQGWTLVRSHIPSGLQLPTFLRLARVDFYGLSVLHRKNG